MARNTSDLRPRGEECDYMKDERARLKSAAQGHFANNKRDRVNISAEGIGRGPMQKPAQGKSRPTPKAAFTANDRGDTGSRGFGERGWRR